MRIPADRTDRRQRLAAKAECGDMREIVVRQFRGAVALDREAQLLACHARTVVGDRNQCLAALLEDNLDARGAGVDRVLDSVP